MGTPSHSSPALLIVAAFSRHPQALEWGLERAIEKWGPVALCSEHFDFDQTTYYEPTMGAGLKKCFWVFQNPIDPGELPAIKLLTNDWEAEYAKQCAAQTSGTAGQASSGSQPALENRTGGASGTQAFTQILESRPLNLDPGYITAAKLVLASTKDHTHRIYLSQGIFAEITLFYRHKRWEHHEWTFPDYRREDYQAFFTSARKYLQSQR
ncbi:MAG: DUF4416 family protein [Planctomycetota bacterium]|nr:DUF4416 family protein [Planctomycetota bacterium]